MRFYLSTTALALFLGATAAVPAMAQSTEQDGNECWSQIQQYDQDGDGKLSQQEFAQNGEEIFKAADQDGNGELTKEEFDKCLASGGEQKTDMQFTDLDQDHDDVVRVEDMVVVLEQSQQEQTRAQGEQAEGAQIRVDQAQPTVNVQQSQPEVTVQQPQPEVTVTQPQPQVEVTQPEPQVEVTQPQPQVQVEQAQPQVEVTQPQPQVQVEQAQPQVQVEQAEPKVQVQEQGQPQVTVQEQGQPEVTVREQDQADVKVEEQERPEQQEQGQADIKIEEQEQATQPTDQAQQESTVIVTEQQSETQARTPVVEQERRGVDLTQYSADDLIGKDVVNAQGEDVGSIEDIVIDSNGKNFFVIGVGGFLGIGEKEVAISAEEFEISEDQLTLQTSQSKDEIEQLPAYDESAYQPYQQ